MVQIADIKPTPQLTKICAKCCLSLPLNSFGKQKMGKNGLRSRCRECHDEDNKSKVMVCPQCDKTFRGQPQVMFCSHSCASKERKATSNITIQEKAIAVNLLNRMIAEHPELRPTQCSLCGCTSSLVDAHHKDYHLPYKVVWLCRSCHQSIHYRQGDVLKEVNLTLGGV